MRWRLLVLLMVAVPLLAAGLLLTRAVLRGEHERAEGEVLRLALWRLDARATALVVGEASRAPESYRSFWSTSEAFGERLTRTGRVLLPSPLLGLPAPPLHLHLRLCDGELTSPQLPVGRERGLALAGLVEAADLAEAERRFAGLRSVLGSDPARLLAGLPAPPSSADSITMPVLETAPPPTVQAAADRPRDRDESVVEPKRQALPTSSGEDEYRSRASNVAEAQRMAQSDNGSSLSFRKQAGKSQASPLPERAAKVAPPVAPVPAAVAVAAAASVPTTPPSIVHASAVGLVEARWAGTDWLLLARRARIDGREELQATVLRWDELRGHLVTSLADLLPQARLLPRASGDPPERCLAALPIRLDPGLLSEVPLTSAARWTLGLAWGALLAGIAGAAGLLIAAQRLAERRAVFVSAVTHELRTPLTALRLHADLLADARVAGDPVLRGQRVQVLRAEAGRLAHLIDNVLDYARLERRRPPEPRAVALAELLVPLVPRLSARLAAAGLELVVAEASPWAVRCDPSAVERILLNLADNAAKYASGTGLVRLDALLGRGVVELRLRDRGPGLAADVRARLFRPFARSAEAAAGSAPGVGLGLALCRRLARAQGGDLRLDEAGDGGVEAVLTLPLA